MKVRYNFFLMVIGLLPFSYLSQAATLPNQLILQNFTNSAPRLLDIVQYRYHRPIANAMYNQQLLEEVQPRMATYSALLEQHRPQNCHLAIEAEKKSNNPSSNMVDQVALFRKTMRTQAMIQRFWISSMVVPGLGQVYNKDYWKVPCLYLGFAFLGYKIYTEHNDMNEHQRNALAQSTLTSYDNKVIPDFTKKRIDECKRTRNLFIIIASAWYLLNILDAYAGAHDKIVNFKDDIQTKSTSKPTALLQPAAAAPIR
ncbi:MAG: DUF5683 domain-containing protein [Candidatus Cardinium sp.]|uniref:DUF5683 domain-containing protein n=1 Tax=Cardinium endosymbiont of Dermatophagoides farinae TaxID=2597823 RepID=UPI001182FE6F|nr:DUF5683 domain-containing protein [Cardinium endosymbiont of Dermatophagoides farinae]TSJ81415.1 hypothetical protein FPG78_05555 [Cardinium endosymbiont of Dermatophagoides farinae]UWW97477.1 MAG: DUF5683 domain-containing protein [Candidatus Cardinium sp.]